jgi:hypothetical protein
VAGVILLLSPRTDDPVLRAFASYLDAHGIAHEYCSDLATLRFGVSLDRDGATRIWLRLPRTGEVAGKDLGVVVRSPWKWQATSDRTNRFVATEYYASLWTVCALLPRVVNRPGQRAWLHERELRYSMLDSVFLPEYWTTEVSDLAAEWKSNGFAQAHVEDLLSNERGVFTTPEQLIGWRSGPTQLRALFAPASKYLIQVCVGSEAATVLNEPRYDVDCPAYRALLAWIVERLAVHGIYFFALAMVVGEDNQVRLARIITEPPWSWYAAYADEVHGNLYALLAATE